MSGIPGPQDGDGLEGLEDEEAGGSNGSKIPESVKITFQGAGRGKKAAVEGQAELDALAALGGGAAAGFTVVRVEVPGWGRQTTLGTLPITLAASDLNPGTLDAKLGRGVYQIGRGKVWRTVTIGSLTPPKDFGTPAPADAPATNGHWIHTPNGPQYITLPPGVPPPPPPPFFAPWGGQQQQPQDIGATVAKALAEALKPVLDLVTKQRDDGGAGKWALEIEKMKLEQAKEESKARAAEAKLRADAEVAAAKEARLAREAELRSQADLEGKRLQAQADAQVKAAEALSKAQTEMAQASIKAAELRAKADESQVDKFFKWQERLAPKESPVSEAIAMFKEINGIAGKRQGWEIFLDGLPKVVQSIGGEVRAIAATVPVAPGQQNQQAPQLPPPLTDETRGEVEEFMSVVKTLRTAVREKKDPAQTVAVLRQPNGAPRVMNLVGRTPANAIVTVMTDRFTRLLEAHDSHVSAANKEAVKELQGLIQTADGVAWFTAFYQAATAAVAPPASTAGGQPA